MAKRGTKRKPNRVGKERARGGGGGAGKGKRNRGEWVVTCEEVVVVVVVEI